MHCRPTLRLGKHSPSCRTVSFVWLMARFGGNRRPCWPGPVLGVDLTMAGPGPGGHGCLSPRLGHGNGNFCQDPQKEDPPPNLGNCQRKRRKTDRDLTNDQANQLTLKPHASAARPVPAKTCARSLAYRRPLAGISVPRPGYS